MVLWVVEAGFNGADGVFVRVGGGEGAGHTVLLRDGNFIEREEVDAGDAEFGAFLA